jgi:hypothetical protein
MDLYTKILKFGVFNFAVGQVAGNNVKLKIIVSYNHSHSNEIVDRLIFQSNSWAFHVFFNWVSIIETLRYPSNDNALYL